MKGWHAAGNGVEVNNFPNITVTGPNKCVIVTASLLGDSCGSHMSRMFGQIGLTLDAVELPQDPASIQNAADGGVCIVCHPDA